MNPYLFVVGCPRSGTTLLQRMLDSHAELAVANDTHFLVRALDGLDPMGPLALTGELVDRVVGYRRFPRLGVPEATARRLAEGSPTYAAFVAALYDRFALDHGKPLGGEKTPDFVQRLPVLHHLFPQAPVVHIVRDGRDVALSVLDWAHESKGPGRFALWREEPVAVAALWWRSFTVAGRRDAAATPGLRYREVVYERLAADPEPELRAVSAFAGLAFDPSMVAFHVGRTIDDPTLSAKKPWRPALTGLRDWRTELGLRDIQLFEALAGDALEMFGYERACDRIPPAVADVAARCRRWWEDDRSRQVRDQRRGDPVR